MTRKLLTLLIAVTFCTAFSACEETHDETVTKIAEALQNQDMATATNLCDKLYADLPNCTVKTLGDLTVSYFTLSQHASSTDNADTAYAMMQRTVDCFDAAMKKSPEEATALWDQMAQESISRGVNFDLPGIVNSFRSALVLNSLEKNAAIEPKPEETAES